MILDSGLLFLGHPVYDSLTHGILSQKHIDELSTEKAVKRVLYEKDKGHNSEHLLNLGGFLMR